jgi:hypothetical protein
MTFPSEPASSASSYTRAAVISASFLAMRSVHLAMARSTVVHSRFSDVTERQDDSFCHSPSIRLTGMIFSDD